VVEYELDDEVDVVLDVIFAQQKLDLSMVFSPFTLLEEKIPYDAFASGASGGLYSSYAQSMAYVEMAKRVLSAELEWRQERTVDKNLLYIAPPPVDLRVLVVDAKVSCFNIQRLSEREHELIRRYALAHAMMDLGTVRSKFGEFPGAQGAVPIDGERLIERAQQMMEKLEEEIMGIGYPLGFLTG